MDEILNEVFVIAKKSESLEVQIIVRTCGIHPVSILKKACHQTLIARIRSNHRADIIQVVHVVVIVVAAIEDVDGTTLYAIIVVYNDLVVRYRRAYLNPISYLISRGTQHAHRIID